MSFALNGIVLILAAFIAVPRGYSGPCVPPSEPVLSPPPVLESRFSLSLESAFLFQPIPNPFFAMAGRLNENPLDYHLATQIVTIRYRLADLGGSGPLRGNLEISAGLIESTILNGPESFYAGYLMGLRYTFGPRNWPLKPYLEVRGGVGWTDSRGFRYAQQQDFCFTYLLGAGVRCEFGPRWCVTLGTLDQHISNCYLTHPNYGFDTVGVQLGVTRRF